MAKAIFPGSFNPFTIGHLDILARGLNIFDSVVLAIGYNEHKSTPESIEANEATLRKLFEAVPNVEVISYAGLTVRAAEQIGAAAILRGFRNSADAEYERLLADTNRLIANVDTILLPSRPELACISSSMVRELSHNDMDVSPYLPTSEQCRKACLKNYQI